METEPAPTSTPVVHDPSAAGLIARRRARSTGTVVGIYRSSEAGMEDDPTTPYATVCEDHSRIVCHTTLTHAKAFASAPEEWCGVCRGDEPKDED